LQFRLRLILISVGELGGDTSQRVNEKLVRRIELIIWIALQSMSVPFNSLVFSASSCPSSVVSHPSVPNCGQENEIVANIGVNTHDVQLVRRNAVAFASTTASSKRSYMSTFASRMTPSVPLESSEST